MLEGVLSLVILVIYVLCYQGWMKKLGRVVTPIHRGWTLVLIFYLWVVMMGAVVAPFYHWSGWMGQSLADKMTPDALMLFIKGLAILGMMPVGFMVPHIWRNYSSAVEVVFVGYLFALILELAQLPTQRMVAVGDVALACLGTFLGYLFWRHIGYYFFCGRVTARQRSVGRWEPLVYLVMVGGVGLLYRHWQWLLI